MNFIRLVFVSLLIVISISCKRIVEIENPYPKEASICQVDPDLLGQWQSDSVWILTEVDSLDTTIINRRPTYYYNLTVACSDDTAFNLQYVNYSGVVSREVFSKNFESTDSTFLIYDAFEEDPAPEKATFIMKYFPTSDSTFSASYAQTLNADQRSEIRLWMRRR